MGAGIAVADPPATFTVSDGSPTILQSVTFTATGEGACAGSVTCSWNFGDGDTGAGSPATHAYLLPGPKTVTLTVDDPDDPADPSTTSQTINVALPPNVPPSVSVSGPASVGRNTAATFTMSASDTDGTIASREWSVDGGGFVAGGASLTTSFASAGTHTVAARVTDDRGGQATDSASIQVTNRAPSVTVAGPATLNKNQAGSFTMTATDPDGAGTIASREWRLDSGAFAAGGVTKSAAFATSGAHTVTARVTDDLGLSDTGSASVTVVNRAPVAALAGPATPPNIGIAASFSAAGSSDPDGDPLTYSWRVDGDAVSGGGAALSRSFANAGSHTVSVTVNDGDGGTHSASVTVVVPNRPPTVDFTWSPKSVDKGDLVTFTSKAVDPDGKPLSRQDWDLDGDGSFDDAFGDTATRTYSTSGSRSIGLRVTDADGAVATGRLTLVPGNKPPTAVIAASPANPAVGQAVTFTSNSRDSDGRVVSLAWDLDGDNAFNEGTGPTASRSFPSVGTHRVGLKVTDEDGSTDTTFVSVVVGASSGVAGASTLKGLKILKPFPKIRLAGSANSRGAFVKLLTVNAPKGAKISITCRKGCPRSKLARLARTVRLASMQGSYRAGAVLVVTVTKKGWIGKYTRITIVKRKAPKRVDLCLFPQNSKPRSCPAGVRAK